MNMKKNEKAVRFHILLLLLLMSGTVFHTPPNALSADKPDLYRVNVESREVTNRIVESRVRGHRVLVDQPKEFGADDVAPSPPEYLAVAYSTCVVSTLRLVAALDKLEIGDIDVRVEGEIDFSKAMGRATANRAGFTGLTVRIGFESDLSEAEKRAFVRKAMERGAVLDNFTNSTPVSYEISE